MNDYEVIKEIAIKLKRYGYSEIEFNYLFAQGIEFILEMFPDILKN